RRRAQRRSARGRTRTYELPPQAPPATDAPSRSWQRVGPITRRAQVRLNLERHGRESAPPGYLLGSGGGRNVRLPSVELQGGLESHAALSVVPGGLLHLGEREPDGGPEVEVLLPALGDGDCVPGLFERSVELAAACDKPGLDGETACRRPEAVRR